MLTQCVHDKPFSVFTIDNAFTDEELTKLSGFVTEKLTGNVVRSFTNSDFLNGKMVDPTISHLLFSRIQPFLPNTYEDHKGATWKYVGATKTIMFAKVASGKHFGIHTDTGCEYDKVRNLFSKYTVLVYLNDNFTGGHTTFFSDDFQKLFSVAPKRGRILCFDIDMFHKGDEVHTGSKLWVGTEVICARM